MPWLAVSVSVPGELADEWSDILLDLGAVSTSIEDAEAGSADEQPVFGEPGSAEQVLWEHNRIVALFDATQDAGALLAAFAAAIGMHPPDWRVDTLADQDWIRTTQADLKPIHVSDRLWIVPSWHTPPAPEAINLHLDPGLAFGTGSHPTTRLCLRWIDSQLRAGESLLDYGCGSGILAIAARLLGAGPVRGVDIDPVAIVAARDNALRNEVEIDFVAPEQEDPSRYDVVVANILTNPLRALAPLLAARNVPAGRLVLSGILSTQAEDIRLAYAPWYDLHTFAEDEGWICLSGMRKP